MGVYLIIFNKDDTYENLKVVDDLLLSNFSISYTL